VILAIPAPAVRLTVAAGVALGVAYALSPLTVWFLAAAAALFAWVGRGLPEPERRRVYALLAAAILLRLIVLAGLALTADHLKTTSFFWDGDGAFLKRRGEWVRGVWLGMPIAKVEFENAFNRAYGWSAYIYLLAYVQYLIGSAPYGVYLLNLALFMAAAAVLFHLARSAYGPEAALLGLGLLAFLPTPFLWSISAMKESLYVFLEVVAIAGTITVLRSRSWTEKLLAAGMVVAVVSANGTVRAGALAISAVGLAGGLIGSVVVRRRTLVVLTLALGMVAGYQMLKRPAVQARMLAQLKTSAVQHIGHVRTEGHSYKLLDQRFYSPDSLKDTISTMTLAEGARFVLRAIAGFIVVPLPWQAESAQEIVFMPQQVVWYGMVLLGIVGFIAGCRRDPLLTCLLAGFTAAGAAAIAMNSGNIGTMVRHRDTVVPFVVWLSALGAVDLAARAAARWRPAQAVRLDFDARPVCE
jgi:hypothetical protein